MKNTFGSLAVLALVACGGGEKPPNLEGAVTLVTADKIYTGNPEQPIVRGVAIGPDGRIVALLGDLNLSEKAVEGKQWFNYPDATLYPGFVDGHAHLQGIGDRELTLNLAGTSSVAELAQKVAAVAAEQPTGSVIVGRGWIETGWPEERMPNRLDLDAVAPNHSVILTRADGHALVANTLALTRGGIVETTPDPSGGKIERDEAGAATGILVDNAMDFVEKLIATPDDNILTQRLETGAKVYAERGWTGLHNMSVGPREAPLMEALDKEDRLPIRVHNAYNANGMDIAIERQYETDTIQNRAVKLYMDGALGSRGALLFDPYSDRPETRGLALRTKEDTKVLLDRAAANNVQIAFHAIGDQANFFAVEWMAEAIKDVEDPRWRVEHAQILRVDDIPLFGETGIIASMQASHAIGDLKFAPARLGLGRLEGAYAWQGLLDTGGVVVGGSDAPVEVGSPLIEFYAAVARKSLEGEDGPGWHPESAVSREDALKMLTAAPAFASFQEDDLGTLEVGKFADISGFDRDLMTIPEADILKANAVVTIVAGETVWKAE
ncbi:MAG: amidohydrolase [Pseudomonadota bacterium]